MNRVAAIGGLVVLAAGAGAAWYGYDHGVIGGGTPVQARVSRAIPAAPVRQASGDLAPASDVVETVGDAAVDTGLTPMKQRVAVIGLLNKRNGVSRDLTLKPGQAVRVGDVVVRLSACEQTAPWEQQTLTGAFIQLDVQNVDHHWQRVFSGWLYKERPQLNVVLHPVYDVWTKSCAMSFPGATPAATPSPAAKRTTTPKSRTTPQPEDSDEAPSETANNAQ